MKTLIVTLLTEVEVEVLEVEADSINKGLEQLANCSGRCGFELVFVFSLYDSIYEKCHVICDTL